ncbi:hypothetical protein H920_01053 [Fukomys damarensis]|uniref:Uncharacterized protein n=1 Tax=Fukomys damarensis TaxID=885580 RepID=A0A091E4C0_FUKDA|nr:hypothetical protein H920_01053 [Fukomys damarensis]
MPGTLRCGLAIHPLSRVDMVPGMEKDNNRAVKSAVSVAPTVTARVKHSDITEEPLGVDCWRTADTPSFSGKETSAEQLQEKEEVVDNMHPKKETAKEEGKRIRKKGETVAQREQKQGNPPLCQEALQARAGPELGRVLGSSSVRYDTVTLAEEARAAFLGLSLALSEQLLSLCPPWFTRADLCLAALLLLLLNQHSAFLLSTPQALQGPVGERPGHETPAAQRGLRQTGARVGEAQVSPVSEKLLRLP